MRNGLLGILVCGIFLFTISWLINKNHHRQERIPFLKETPITSLESDLKRDRSTDDNNYYEVQVNYSYQVEGRSFSNNDIWWVSSGHQKDRRRNAQDLKERIDKRTMVWYDPDQPDDSALIVESEDSINSTNFWITILWWVMAVVAVCCAVAAIWHAIQFAQGQKSSLWKRE